MTDYEKLGEQYRNMDDGEFSALSGEVLSPEARGIYENEAMRRAAELKYTEEQLALEADKAVDDLALTVPKDEYFKIKVGYSKWSGWLFLTAAGLNILASLVTAHSYPPLRLFPMLIFAVIGLRYLIGTAYTVDNGGRVITFHALIGPLKRRVKYTGLKLDGERIFYCREKDDKTKELTLMNICKEDERILKAHIRNLTNGSDL